MDAFMIQLDATQTQRCRDLIIAAAHYQDSRDLSAFAACFATDGVLVRPGGEAIIGPDAIEAAYRARDPQRITQHLLMNQRVESLSASPAGALRARVHSKVLLWTSHESQALSAKGRPADPLQQIGEFDDELIEQQGQWKIAKREAKFLLFQAF
jgi:ketosteroid isomerase-like protein